MTLLYIGGEHQVFVAELSFSSSGDPGLQIKQTSQFGEMPSFLAFSSAHALALVVLEGADELVSLRVADDGHLTPLSRVSCPGGPAYVSIDPSGRFAFTASYGSGETRLFRILEGGELSPAIATVETGMFSHCAAILAQSGPRRGVFCASKGTDSIAEMAFDPETGSLILERRHLLPRGSGPRHLVFSPQGDVAYVSGENDCSLMALKYADHNWSLLAHDVALVGAKRECDSGSDVHLSADGRFVYLSLRGEDSLAVYHLSEGALHLVERHDTRGRVPRNFCLLGDDLLVVANQESANLSVFHRDNQRGTLEYRGTLETPERAFWVGNCASR